MNRTTHFIIRNIWWLVPLAVVLLFWEHTSPILLMLVFAYLGQVILNPIISIVEKWIGSRKWSIVIIMILLIICLSILSSSLFPLISNQIIALQSALSMETLAMFQVKLIFVLESIFPAFLLNLFKDAMGQMDSIISEIWASGLSHIKSFIGGASSVAFALGSAFLSLLIIIVFMIVFLWEGKNFSNAFLHAVPG